MSENCYLCRKIISEREMRKSTMGDLFGDILGGNAKYMPNVMEGLAMKCNRCNAWVCIDCAQKAALSQQAGMLRHSSCGGMFETPS